MQVLVLLVLNLLACRAVPNWFLGGGGNGTGPGGAPGCGPCEPDLCPEPRGCRAGLVPDPCGCCEECGNLEGQACDPGARNVRYGLCGTGLRCQADPGPAGGEDEEEEVCVCEDQEPLCGTDGTTYMNLCRFREAAFSEPELRSRGPGPCRTGEHTCRSRSSLKLVLFRDTHN